MFFEFWYIWRPIVICLVKAIANLKKRFVIQIVVVWKPCAECPADGCTWRKCFPKKLTYLLTYLLVSQTKCGKCANSAIFQMTIFIRFIDHTRHTCTEKAK